MCAHMGVCMSMTGGGGVFEDLQENQAMELKRIEKQLPRPYCIENGIHIAVRWINCASVTAQKCTERCSPIYLSHSLNKLV